MEASNYADKALNPMRQVRLEKTVVHIGVGKSGEVLERASKVLAQLTGRRPTECRAKKTVKDFGIRQGEPIACQVTLRGGEAEAFLKRALVAVGNKLSATAFDDGGNFSLGIREHIEVPQTKYVPELGIFGMNVTTRLERPGFRVSRRRFRKSHVGRSHRIKREDAIRFVKDTFKIQVVGE